MKLNKEAVVARLTAERPIAETLDDTQIQEIQSACQNLYDRDSESCSGWRNEAKDLMEMARMISKKRSHIQDWQADIQVPDLIQAAIQFNARTYPEYVKDGKICKPKITGKVTDAKRERAQRVTDHMNWQLTEQISEWPENLDKLLIMLPIVGHLFKVNTYDDNIGRIANTLCMPDQVTINNKPNTPDWSRRISVEYPVNRNEAASKRAAGLWRDVTLQPMDGNEDDPHYAIVDMHTWYDLDGDGYEEPYVITLDKSGWQLLSIIPRYDVECLKFKYDPKQPQDNELVGIDAIEYITSYAFIPSPDGCALGIGYGHIGKGLITTENMCLNQLMDSGTMNNLSAGIIKKGVFRDDGALRFRPGEWKVSDSTNLGNVSESIWPIPVNAPSPVTLQVFQEQKGAFAAITATSEIASGSDMPQNATATAVLAVIDQAKMGARAVLKRINIAMGREFKVIYRLNKTTLPDELYFTVGDFEERKVVAEDYNTADFDVVPVADPNYSSRIERLTKIQAAMQLGVHSEKLIRGALIELGYTAQEADEYLATNQNKAAQEAQAQMAVLAQQEKAAKAQAQALEAQRKAMAEEIRLIEVRSKVMVDKTVAIKNLADAEATEAGTQLSVYAAAAEQLERQEGIADEQGEQGGLRTVAAQPGDEGGIGEDGAAGEGMGQPAVAGPADEGAEGLELAGGAEIPAGEGVGSLGMPESGAVEGGGVEQ